MKYYYKEHLTGYRCMLEEGKKSWGELHGNPDDFERFSSRSFLDEVLPKLRFGETRPEVLEYGTGTGPVACYLAERGFQVEAADLIPAAIEVARGLAEERKLSIDFKVLDICRLPHEGRRYDLIVDSYCLQGIVMDTDRENVFAAVQARLKPNGYYLISTAMYVSNRDFPGEVLADPAGGRTYHRYGPGGVFDPDAEIFYEPFAEDKLLDDKPKDYDGTLKIGGEWYMPKRRYRKPETLKRELEQSGFRVVHQSGSEGENIICVHPGHPLRFD